MICSVFSVCVHILKKFIMLLLINSYHILSLALIIFITYLYAAIIVYQDKKSFLFNIFLIIAIPIIAPSVIILIHLKEKCRYYLR